MEKFPVGVWSGTYSERERDQTRLMRGLEALGDCLYLIGVAFRTHQLTIQTASSSPSLPPRE